MSVAKKNERAKLQAELQVKQEVFVKKERVYQSKIEEQEATIRNIRDERTSWMSEDESIANLRKIHAEIQSKVSTVQIRTAKLVQEQEQELLRAFRQRLSDVQVKSRRHRERSFWHLINYPPPSLLLLPLLCSSSLKGGARGGEGDHR